MAVDPTLENFRLVFPEFDPVADVAVEIYLDPNRDNLSTTAWGNCWGKAVLYLTAHELALAQNRQFSASESDGKVQIPAQSGVISSSSAGGLSASFTTSASQSSGNDNQSWLQQTPYGQRYAALKRQCLSLGRLVTC